MKSTIKLNLPIIILLLFNAVFGITFIVVPLFFPTGKPAFNPMRENISETKSIDELKPKAQHLIDILEEQDNVLLGMRSVITQLAFAGAVTAIGNILLFYLLLIRPRKIII